MARLEELTRGAHIGGILPDLTVQVVDVRWFGSSALELTYTAPDGQLGNQLLYRDSEPTLTIASAGRQWAFTADGALDRAHLQELIRDRALASDTMDVGRVFAIREEMERAEARRLQPHYVASFFLEAFRRLGGSLYEREPGRYEITRVPGAIRNRDRVIGTGEAILPRYERITFEKLLISVHGKPLAALVCPGHPLLDATIDLIQERHRDLLKQGAVLVDDSDAGTEPRALFYLEHAIQDARITPSGTRRIVSRRLQFVEIDRAGTANIAGYAPYLDYRPLREEERPVVEGALSEVWPAADMEEQATGFAVEQLVPLHLSEVRNRREAFVTKTMAAVKERLTKEIAYWDHRAEELKAQEEAGKTPRLNSAKARQRADELTDRLQKRMEDLAQERQVSPVPPVVIGGALVVPAGLLAKLRPATPETSETPETPGMFAHETERVERLAMEAVMAVERRLGYSPRDVSAAKVGYDIESRVAPDKPLRFIEVKGRITGAATVTITRNEILTALNKPEEFILAIVEIEGDAAKQPRYVRRPFAKEPDFGATSVNYDMGDLLTRAEAPA